MTSSVSPWEWAASRVVAAARFLSRHRIPMACLGLVLTVVVAFTYIAIGGLRINPLRSTMSVRVMLPESGGLLANQDVTLRGIPIGRIESINITDTGVEAIASVDASERIPRNSPVRVAGLSAAGEQYLDFRPERGGGPYLTDGTVLPAGQAAIPVSLPKIIDDSRGALAQLDATKLKVMFEELRVQRDGPRKLAAIFDGASLLAATLDDVLPQTVSMLKTSRVFFNTLSDVTPGLNRTSTNLDEVLAGVNKMDGGFRTLVERANPQLATIDDFINGNRENVVQLLGNLTTVSQLFYYRIPALENLWRPDRDSVIDRASSVLHDGGIWAIADLYPKYRCDYGLPRLPPSQADFPEPNRYTYCPNADPALLVRGARNAPRPPGDDTAGPPPGSDPLARTDPTPNHPPYTMPTPYGGPSMPTPMPN